MGSDIDMVARLLAFRNGRAERIASHRQVVIKPNAAILCPIAMAGEDTTIHIVAFGRIGAPPEIRCVADPRVRDDQYTLFEWMGDKIERYFQACRTSGDYPQLWVSSTAAASHLDTLADRFRYNRDNVRVRRFGELLSYATERFPVAGQQTLVTATSALRLHFATGQQDGEDEHLGALLTWIEPPIRNAIFTAVARAEEIPMGVKTDPAFDRRTLAPLVQAFNAARHSNASATSLDRHRTAIQQVLEPVVREIYCGVQRAITILMQLGLPSLPDLTALSTRERDEYLSFMDARDQGIPLPLHDKAKRAAFGLADREDALENLERATLRGDRVTRARACLAGDVVVGIVSNARRLHTGPHRYSHRFDISSTQRKLHIRRCDDLVLLTEPRLVALVRDVRRSGRTTLISLEVVRGMRCVGTPANGTQVQMGKPAPDWNHIFLLRKQMGSRLRNVPWTHQDNALPASAPSAMQPPADLVQAVEDLA